MRTWYEIAITGMLRLEADNPTATLPEMKKLIRDAYPFGERKHWPYKAWLSARRDFLNARERQKAWKGGDQ